MSKKENTGVNMRHDLDPALVLEQIEESRKQCLKYLDRELEIARNNEAEYASDVADGSVSKKWKEAPATVDEVEAYSKSRWDLQREHYAKVRVIELPKRGKRFVLVYGDVDDASVTSGTGPFESVEAAAGWFYRGGR